MATQWGWGSAAGRSRALKAPHDGLGGQEEEAGQCRPVQPARRAYRRWWLQEGGGCADTYRGVGGPAPSEWSLPHGLRLGACSSFPTPFLGLLTVASWMLQRPALVTSGWARQAEVVLFSGRVAGGPEPPVARRWALQAGLSNTRSLLGRLPRKVPCAARCHRATRISSAR